MIHLYLKFSLVFLLHIYKIKKNNILFMDTIVNIGPLEKYIITKKCAVKKYTVKHKKLTGNVRYVKKNIPIKVNDIKRKCMQKNKPKERKSPDSKTITIGKLGKYTITPKCANKKTYCQEQ